LDHKIAWFGYTLSITNNLIKDTILGWNRPYCIEWHWECNECLVGQVDEDNDNREEGNALVLKESNHQMVVLL